MHVQEARLLHRAVPSQIELHHKPTDWNEAFNELIHSKTNCWWLHLPSASPAPAQVPAKDPVQPQPHARKGAEISTHAHNAHKAHKEHTKHTHTHTYTPHTRQSHDTQTFTDTHTRTQKQNIHDTQHTRHLHTHTHTHTRTHIHTHTYKHIY